MRSLPSTPGFSSRGAFTIGNAVSEAQLAAFVAGLGNGTVVAGALLGDTYVDFASPGPVAAALSTLGVTPPTLRTFGGTGWAFLATKGASSVNSQVTRGYSWGGVCLFLRMWRRVRPHVCCAVCCHLSGREPSQFLSRGSQRALCGSLS